MRVLNIGTPVTLQQEHSTVLVSEQYIVTHTIHQTDCRNSRQLGYKHTSCQNVLSTKRNCFFSYLLVGDQLDSLYIIRLF